MSEIEITQADREAARKFIADEWPSWDHDHQTVSAELMVAFARHRHEARAEALEEAAKVAASYSDGFALRPAEGWSELEKAGFETGVLDASLAIAAALRSGGEWFGAGEPFAAMLPKTTGEEVERVGLAIMNSKRELNELPPLDWPSLSDGQRGNCIWQGRAAIAAMNPKPAEAASMREEIDVSKAATSDDFEFSVAWQKMEAKGYQWSEDDIEKAHLGWLMARDNPPASVAAMIEALKAMVDEAVINDVGEEELSFSAQLAIETLAALPMEPSA